MISPAGHTVPLAVLVRDVHRLSRPVRVFNGGRRSRPVQAAWRGRGRCAPSMTSVHHRCSGLGSGQCTSAELSSAASPAESVVRRRAAAGPRPGGATAGLGVVGCAPGLFDTAGEGGLEADAIEAGPVAGMVMAAFLSRIMIRGRAGRSARPSRVGPRAVAVRTRLGGHLAARSAGLRVRYVPPLTAGPVPSVRERTSPPFMAVSSRRRDACEIRRTAFACPEPFRPSALWPQRRTAGADGPRPWGDGRAQSRFPSDQGRTQRLVDLHEQLLEARVQSDQPGLDPR